MSTLTPSNGFSRIEEEFEKRTADAFRKMGGESGYISITSRRQRFQLEAAEYCSFHGWITEGELVQLDEQSSELRYRITDCGRKHWGIQ